MAATAERRAARARRRSGVAAWPILGALLAMPRRTDARVGSGDCQCSCCHPSGSGEACALEDFFYMAGSSDLCSEEICSARFIGCPDPGAHNAGGRVFATYSDCECSCCNKNECAAGDFFTGRLVTREEDFCTPDLCRAKFAQCLDEGSHNEGHEVTANFLGASLDKGDCTCLCCDDEVDCKHFSKYTRHVFAASSEASCNADVCRAKFAGCLDRGSHNSRAAVLVTYTPKNETQSSIMPDPRAESDSGMQSWLIVLIAGLCGGAIMAGIWIVRSYIAFRQGYQWVNMNNPAFADIKQAHEQSGAADKAHLPNGASDSAGAASLRVEAFAP